MFTKLISSLGATALLVGACTIKNTDDGDATGGTTSSGGAAGSSTGGGAGTGGGSGTSGGAAGADAGGQAGSAEGGAGGADAGSAGAMGGAGGTAAGAGGTAAGAAGNEAGGAGGTGAISQDSCSDGEITANDDRTSATPYALNTRYSACLQDIDDVDFYEFTAPSDSKGGYINVSVTDVGPNGDIALEAFSAADDGSFHEVSTTTDGGSLYFYFNGKPGATYRVAVTKYVTLAVANPYVFQATYTEVPDVHEPNDLRPQATPISVGTGVDAYVFAGWENSTGIPDEAWLDWYEVDLAVGNVTVLMSIVAADHDGAITLFDSVGTQVATASSTIDGSSVQLQRAIATAGTYYLRVSPYVPPVTKANTVTVPQYLTLPYNLKVTQ